MDQNKDFFSKVRKPEHRKQRFSLRKFGFGVASILVGSYIGDNLVSRSRHQVDAR